MTITLETKLLELVGSRYSTFERFRQKYLKSMFRTKVLIFYKSYIQKNCP